MFILMLILGCLLAMSVYAAKESSKEKAVVPAVKTDPAVLVKKPKTDTFKTEMDKVSYAIGTQLAQNFKRQSVEIKIESFVRGIKDVMAGRELALTQEEMKQVMTGFSQRMRAKKQEKQKAEAAKNLAAGKAFLAANGKKEGVKVLPSGLQYKVIKKGTGKSPTAEDKFRTHYRGTLINGTEFDSSYKLNKPSEFAVKGVIKGWTEALQMMPKGSKWKLFIPSDLAYGPRGAGAQIGPNSTLIFDIELVDIK